MTHVGTHVALICWPSQVKGRRYFQCDPGHGIFRRRDRCVRDVCVREIKEMRKSERESERERERREEKERERERERALVKERER